MKKVIEGALYNTETATYLGSYHNGVHGFAWWKESLYRTKSGKYFLHGAGGPQSQYGEWHGNSGGDGEVIRPYTIQEAMEWAEERLDGDEYSTIFGEPDEASENKAVINLSLPIEIKWKLERLKSETGRSISAIVTELVEKL